MIQKIMVVDDDSNFRKSIVRSLEMNDYTVIEATNGKEALGILEMEKVDLVLSDVKMPILNGIEFLHRMKRDNAEIPFLMMTGFSEVIEIKEAYEIGADGFLAKPYKENDLMAQIKKIGEGEQGKVAQDKFIGVPLDEFVAAANIKFSIFMQIEAENFVKVANPGETISHQQIEEFKQKGIEQIFIPIQEFKEFIEFNFSIRMSILKSERLPNIKKLKFCKILLNHLSRFLISQGEDTEVINRILEVKEDILNLLKEKSLMLDFKSLLKLIPDTVEINSLSSVISIYLLEGLPWKAPTNSNEVFLGAILQDISLKNQTHDDRRDHSLESIVILDSWEIGKDDFKEMILHTHENIDGSGYPSGLVNSQIHPLGNLINLTTKLVRYMVQMNLSLEDAMCWIIEREAAHFRSEYITRLEEEFNS